jgi:hypothetical protein
MQSLANIITVSTSRQMRGTRQVACLSINAQTFVVGNLKETANLENTHLDGR